MNMREQLILVSDAFARTRGIGRKRLSTIVFNRGSRLDDIEAGADLGTGTFEKAMVYFSDNWPDGAAWPEAVARPSSPIAAPPVCGAESLNERVLP